MYHHNHVTRLSTTVLNVPPQPRHPAVYHSPECTTTTTSPSCLPQSYTYQHVLKDVTRMTSSVAIFFWATISKTVRRMLSDGCLSVGPVCNFGVLWPDSLMDQDETWHAGRPRPWPHCVRWETSSPSRRGTPLMFGPYLLCLNGWMD